jgi:hypothetical protein
MKINQWLRVAAVGCLMALAAPALLAQDEVVGWQHDCSSIKDWYSSQDDASFGAKIEQAEASAFKITHDGKDTWGKVAFVVKDVDVDASPILEVKVNKVDTGSAFKVALAPLDWNNLYVVIPRSSADGVHKGDIKAATGWSGKKSFNVVLILEGKGKSVYFDNIKITSKK